MKWLKNSLKILRDMVVGAVKAASTTVNWIFKKVEQGLNWVGDKVPGLGGLGTVSKVVAAGLVIAGGITGAYQATVYFASYGYITTFFASTVFGFIGLFLYPLVYMIYPPSLGMFLLDTILLTLGWNLLKTVDKWLSNNVNLQEA